MAAEASDSPQPVNFGKRLAHTDKVVRDRGFKTLKKWLSKHEGLERLEFMKLWKGLYFGMWMADKRPVQQDLAVNVALLLNEIPRAKQGMWIDTFWETMQAAWEKLDVHRISKYLLFIRIVIAERFKSIRVAGWPLEEMAELGKTFTRAMPMHAKQGPNAPSLGLLLQFTRILWEELRPQLEVGAFPSKAVFELLEPFHVLAEGSAVNSLVGHVHEHIFRKAPRELLSSLTARILEGAARSDVPKKNRQSLYESADALESAAKAPATGKVKPLLLSDGLLSQVSVVPEPLLLPPPIEALPAQQAASKKQKGKKRKAKNLGGGADGMSPLVLPKAMLSATADGSASSATETKVRPQKKKERKKLAP